MVRETSSDFLRIDLSAGKIRKIISACKSESIHRTVHFSVVNNGTPIDLSNIFYAEILINRVDGTKSDNACIIDGEDIQYTLRSNDVSVVGENEAHLMLTFLDGTVLETPVFYINVFSTFYDQDALQSQNEYTTLTQQVLNAKGYAEDAQSEAVSAQGYASNAQGYADSASTNASETTILRSETAVDLASTSEYMANASAYASAAASDAAVATSNAGSTSADVVTAGSLTSQTAEKASEAANYMASTSNYNASASTHASTASSNASQTASDKSETANYMASASAFENSASEDAAYAHSCAVVAEEAAESAVAGGLKLGETDKTAYRGDRGKAAYNHAQITGNPHGTTYIDVGADASGAAASALSSANGYTDTAVGALHRNIYSYTNTAAASKTKVITLTDNNITLRDGDILYVNFAETNSYNSTAVDYVVFDIAGVEYDIVSFVTPSGQISRPTSISKAYYGEASTFCTYKVDVTNHHLYWLQHSVDANTGWCPQALGIGFGVCDTAAATAAKEVTINNYTLLTHGIVTVKFTYSVPANATLNVSGKGAKAIYFNSAAITADIISAGDKALFIYDGTRYHLIAVDNSISKIADLTSRVASLEAKIGYPIEPPSNNS